MKIKPIIIAIDGFAGCGKSTLAKSLANELGFTFLDTGAMYRALSLYFIEKKIAPNHITLIENELDNIRINFEYNLLGKRITLLNGLNVEDKIRSLEVSNQVTSFSSICSVRKKLIEQQRLIGINKGIVLDGRDIGTVVFPSAECKFFITASIEVRAKRRFEEYARKNPSIKEADIIANLHQRDFDETTRVESPLIKAENVHEIDTSLLTKKEALQIALDIVLRDFN